MADDMLKNRVVFAILDMENDCSIKELVYKTAGSHELKMTVYIPKKLSTEGTAPGVIFIHGGPFPSDITMLPTEWGQYISLGQLAASYGFIGVTFHHRYHELNLIKESAQDVEDAIQYLRLNADTFHLNRDELCLWAISGGGIHLSPTFRKKPHYIKCIIAYYARLDLRGIKEVEQILDRETLYNFSPVMALKNAKSLSIPIYLVRAGLDKPDLNYSIDKFVEIALSKNVPIDISNHAEGRHAFDILDDQPRSREIIKRTLNFIRSNLKTGE